MTTQGRAADSPAALLTILYLGVAAGVQMTDRGLLALLSPAIQASFGVGDAVIGALHGIAGILVASLLAIPLARLADQYSRKAVLLFFIAAWVALTALGALAPWFPLFFAGRAAAGVTEFALIPVIYSMLPDLVRPGRRVAANLSFAALMSVGAASGYALGGWLVDQAAQLGAAFPGTLGGFETWRLAMVMIAGLGLPLLLLGFATVDPPRRAIAAEAATGSLPAFLRAQGRTIGLLVLAAGGVAIAVQGLMPLLALALTRRFSFDLGMLGEWLGVIVLATNLASLGMAGLMDRLLPAGRQEAGRPLVMALGALLALPCVLLLPWLGSVQAVLVLVTGFLLATCLANAFIPTMVQDLVPPPLRARAFASYSVIIAAFCAIGPVLMGAVSDQVMGRDLLGAITWVAVPSLAVAALAASFAGWRILSVR
ncbi:MFS transporter [Falsiroseomonas frigidaquae]